MPFENRGESAIRAFDQQPFRRKLGLRSERILMIHHPPIEISRHAGLSKVALQLGQSKTELA
jgi:hypothetical protein